MSDKLRILVWMSDVEERIRSVNLINRSGKYQAIEYRSAGGQIESLILQKPEVVLIDIDTAVSHPEEVAKQLRSKINGVHLIGLSRQWDEFKRKHMEGTFDSVLTVPFDYDSIEHAIVDAVSRDVKIKSDAIAFFAPKGKSGRTSLIINLASALARVSGERVAIIDAETGFADVSTFLNLNPQSTIVEAIRDLNFLTINTLGRYFERIAENVDALPGIKMSRDAVFVTPDGLTKLIAQCKRSYRYVLIDLSAGFNPVSIAACEAADLVYVTAMDNASFELKHAASALEIMKSLDNWEKRVQCVISRKRPDLKVKTELEEQLGVPVVLIPNEYLLTAESANNGRIAIEAQPKSEYRTQIDLLAEAIVNK